MKIKENILNIFNYRFPKKEIKEINRLDFDKKVYTTLEEAIAEINKRREDKDLIRRVEEYLGEIPEPFSNGICAVLFRFIATPQFETKRFFDIVTGYDIRPLFWEYYDDKFHSGNFCKYTLGKIFIYMGMGKTGKSIIKKETVLDFNSSNGIKIKDLRTIKGESLIDFHHRLLNGVIPNSDEFLYDSSPWLKLQGGQAEMYYKKFLALFLCHGILFENFLFNKEESDFNKNVFLPAFLMVEKKFGIKPLIVAIAPTEIEGSEFWNSYPFKVEAML